MTDSAQPYHDVLAGSREAIDALLKGALDTLGASAADPIETIATAELWARFAATSGDFTDERVLIGVLLLRAGMDCEHNRHARNAHHAEAIARLARLSDMGMDKDDAVMLHEIGEANAATIAIALSAQQRAIIDAADMGYAKLAAGDGDAIDATLVTLANQVGSSFESGSPSGEALTSFGHIAQLAAAAGRPQAYNALASVMFYRARLYRRRGDEVRAGEACRTGLDLTLELASHGNADALATLPQLTEGLDPGAFKDAVVSQPLLLATIEPRGAC